MSESTTPPTQKEIDDYEYKVAELRIDRENRDVIGIVFSEVDNLDGFCVWVPVSELRRMVKEGVLKEWAEDRVAERKNRLKQDKQKEKEVETAKSNIKDIESLIKALRFKGVRSGGRGAT